MGHSSVANGATEAVASMVTLMYDPVTAFTAQGGGLGGGGVGVQPPFIENGRALTGWGEKWARV